MAITDNKITTWTSPVTGEADNPVRTASAMKAVFDSNSNQLKTALNDLIDDLVGEGGSAEIGSAAIDDIAAGTLLEQLTAIRAVIDERVATISIGTVTTGAAGSSASVTVTGTMPEVVLNFTIPKGDDGDPTEPHASSHATGGDDAVTPAAIGAAASGANSDLTSLSGLTTALSVAQGGTGGTTEEEARTNLGAAAAMTITGNANASPALGTLENNTEYRCTNTSLSAAPTLTIAAISSTSTEFAAAVVYKSPGTSAPTVTNSSGYTAKYQGLDVSSSGTFSPKTGTVYRLSIVFDGLYLNFYVSGVGA